MGKKFNFDFLYLLILVLLSVGIVYFTPGVVSRLFFLVILPFVWTSKKDYFWFAFFFMLLNQPGGLFSGGEALDDRRLPLYSLAPGLSLTITDLYFILIFVKALKFRHRFKNKLKLEFAVLIVLFSLLSVVSLGYGLSLDSIAQTIRVGINCTLFYSVLYIFRDFSLLSNFLRSIMPFVFFAVALQLFGLTFKFQLIEVLKPGAVRNLYEGAEFGLEERPIELVSLVFVAFCGTLYLLSINRKYRIFSDRYLLIINLTGLLSMALSGTRSWTVAFVLAWVFFLIISRGKMIKYFFQGILTVIGLLIALSFSPVLNKQMISAFERISTVSSVVEGDSSLGGSARRYQVYAPKLWDDYLSTNLIFGAGFSDFYYKNANIHVGYHNMILHFGILGVLLHIWFYLRIMGKSLFRKAIINKMAFIPFLIFLTVNFGVQVIGWGVIHQYFFAVQAFALGLLFAGDRMILQPQRR